jgi:hypothetical protein
MHSQSPFLICNGEHDAARYFDNSPHNQPTTDKSCRTKALSINSGTGRHMSASGKTPDHGARSARPLSNSGITQAELEFAAYDVWHGRAVFHFLTTARDRAAYVRQVARAVKPGGHVIVSTFEPEG